MTNSKYLAYKLKKFFLQFVFFFLSPLFLFREHKKKIVVLICSYNNSKYVNKNLNSVLMQNYTNYRIIYINDCSSDETKSKVENFSELFYKKNIKFHLINNIKKIGSLASKYNYINEFINDDEIVVVLDGDDSLIGNYVFNYLNYIYSKHNIWVTYGSYLNTSGKISFQKKYPKNVISSNNFRQYFHPSHLRTYYAFLFKKINKMYFTDNAGAFFKTGEDKATMYPLLELAGNRHKFINFFLYLYNDTNPIGLYSNEGINHLKEFNSTQIKKMKSIRPLD